MPQAFLQGWVRGACPLFWGVLEQDASLVFPRSVVLSVGPSLLYTQETFSKTKNDSFLD